MGELFVSVDKRLKEIEGEVYKLKINVKKIVKQYKQINEYSKNISEVFNK
jgi:hypothetical protein